MKKILYLLLQGLLIIACQDNVISNLENNLNIIETIPEQHGSIEGMLIIKMQDDILNTINNNQNELSLPTGNEDLDEYLYSIGAYKLKRVFPYAGKHEPQQVESNLHAWYTVWLDHNMARHQTRSKDIPINKDIISYIEPVFEPILQASQITKSESPVIKERNNISPFNDPMFYKQWNLFNQGITGNYTIGRESIISSIKGADINIIPAWMEESGSPEVVIAIVDGGIDVTHEDLKDNIWINKDEIPGNGIDDDNNGFIDDVYGYNFVDETGTLKPNAHGTHVAGIIAAKNNNGIGISSIAGGDGSQNSGVRIMNCQIFKDNPNWDPFDSDSPKSISTKSSNLTAAAIVYGANNGAIISQNSWGYDVGVTTPKVVKEAINYFIKNAGRNKFQEAPMQGGIVVFAASNDSTQQKTYPAGEPEVITVAAYAPDFTATWYTNYGNWIDVSAPGGSDKVGLRFPYENGKMTSGIYSTLPSENGIGQYGFMEGTSMACPHVSAIAGLIISKYGGDNFTNEDLKKKTS